MTTYIRSKAKKREIEEWQKRYKEYLDIIKNLASQKDIQTDIFSLNSLTTTKAIYTLYTPYNIKCNSNNYM